MAKKGNLVVEGAKFYCTNSADHNAPGTAATLKVTSQTKKLGKNKYFAADKPIGTYLDDKAPSFDNGQGFGNCLTPDGKQMPCAGKCNIKYSDYYENVEFNSSMKILLDISTGKCPGYGKPGDIKISDCGQAQKTSTIKVNERDAFEVNALSPQWPIADPATRTSVKSIVGTAPFAAKAGDVLYYLDKKSNGIWDSYRNATETKLSLTADFTGDESKIIWALFKGTDTKDKVKTFVGIGKSITLFIDKLFKDLEEGKYRIEAYGSRPGDKNCFVIIDYIKNFVDKITTPGESLLKNIAMPFTLQFKINTNAFNPRVLNIGSFGVQSPVIWTVSQGDSIVYKTGVTTSTNVVQVNALANSATITFRNAGKYKVSATTNESGKPFSKEITVADKIGVKTVSHGGPLLRITDTVTAAVKDYNVSFLGNATKTVQWYLKKEGAGRIAVFEQSSISKSVSIAKRVVDFLNNDAHLTGSLYGNYVLEAYGSALSPMQNPEFKGSGAYLDCYNFEVAKNSITEVALPETIPLNAKVKFNATTRMPIANGEKIVVETESGAVVNNNDGTLTFKEEGEFEIKLHLEGNETDPKVISKKVKVAAPEVKRALWAYASGYKRTETGYKEESYGFIELAGMAKQQLTLKVWLKGTDDSFYSDAEKKFLLEEKQVTLSDAGKASFKINTTDDYKAKIEKAMPPTAENPNPAHQLIFTMELITAENSAITFPSDLLVKNARAIEVEGKTMYEVLEANEVLSLTSEQKIKSIVFSDEAGKDIQRAQTFYGKTHKIWVHTVNMQDDELQVNVYKEIPGQAMTAVDGTVSALTSKKKYPDEKVGADSMLKLDFTPEKEWNDPEKKTVDFYFASVSKKGKDAEGKDIFIPVKSQITLSNANSKVELVTTKDLEDVGLKAKKEDGSEFTQEEMIKLRKEYLFYENGCLKVSATATQEAIENDISPVTVEMAEITTKKDCYCNKPLTEKMLKDIVQKVAGRTTIWTGCELDDESWEGLLTELNAAFSKYEISTCMQKISFFAQVYGETDMFVATKEAVSQYASSQSTYKGRGLIQLTGERAEGATLYEVPGPYQKYADYVANPNIVTNPDLISDKLHYTVDSAGWMWSINKKCPNWSPTDDREPIRWKSEYFKKGLGQSLNGIANFIEEDEKYFYLQAKILNGYSPLHKLDVDPHGWAKRQTAFRVLKNDVFEFDIRCKGGDESELNLSGRTPWMDVAVKEAKDYGGKDEGSINERITMYHKDGGGLTAGSGTAWCASFVCWVIEQKGYSTPHSAGSRMFLSSDNVEKCDAFYGAVAVFSDCDSTGENKYTKGHVTFAFGKLPGTEMYACLGGNQGDMLKMSRYDCSGNAFVSWRESNGTVHYKIFRGFYKPKGYVIRDVDKFTDNDSYATADAASQKALNLTITSNENGENSQ